MFLKCLGKELNGGCLLCLNKSLMDVLLEVMDGGRGLVVCVFLLKYL